jgi:propionyl-CoA synthetase
MKLVIVGSMSIKRLPTLIDAAVICRRCNLSLLQRYSSFVLHNESITNPAKFWTKAASGVVWMKPFDSVLTKGNSGSYTWFPGGQLNTAYNCLDRHVEAGFGAKTAVIFDSAVTATVRKLTYEELLNQTKEVAGVLRGLGVGKGDRVIIFMPNIPEAVISMLACARIGAIHSVVFGGFAASELAIRIQDCTPKVIIASSCGLEGMSKVVDYKVLLDDAIKLAAAATSSPSSSSSSSSSLPTTRPTCIIFQRE